MKVGYTQGTYDMFHIGHLNLLKHAKEKCDYLIVGVNSDELVKSYKHKPIISQEDRMAIVEAIKYVDKVVLCETLDKMDAWNKNNFDFVFIGSDWQGSQRWNDTEKALEAVNAKVIYLPYTDKISSTKIREAILASDES